MIVTEIGTSETVFKDIAPDVWLNGPCLWHHILPQTVAEDAGYNKYSRGHAVVLGGADMPGAGCLAASACRRAGAGLVTIAAPDAAFDLLLLVTQEYWLAVLRVRMLLRQR